MRERTGRGGGAFVLSLDFELMWGVSDHRTIADYGENVLGVRTMVPRMLDLFDRYDIGCTWATVGFLLCADRDELMACLPKERPAYRDQRLSNYSHLDKVGADERRDPYHFAPSLVDRIAERPRQEIGTHTLSHYYCLEDGHRREAFAADIQAALTLARAKGHQIRSIVFPRNQVSDEALSVCREAGITIYRGTGRPGGDGAGDRKQRDPLRRATRLADSYVEFGPRPTQAVENHGGMCNVPASLFLRPYARRLAPLEPLKLHRILNAMRREAKRGGLFHLWFHPENFGVNQEANFKTMTVIAQEASKLRDLYGWPTLNMAEAAELAETQSAAAPDRARRASHA